MCLPELPNIENYFDFSTDQKLQDLSKAVNAGQCDVDIGGRKPEPISSARCLTTAIRILLKSLLS